MFQRFSSWISKFMGSSIAFCGAVLVVVVWLLTGPVFHFSSDWQLYINTGTTIITFLMVFLIQNTQNRDMAALHLKLDALIKQIEQVDSRYARIQDKSIEEINKMGEELQAKAV